MMALYHNEGTGIFIDDAPTSAIGPASLLTLTFGCFFFDYDLDGRLDIFAANGHVADDINRVQPKVTYAQPAHLFRNLGHKQFQEVTNEVGSALRRPMVARGAAFADYDNDGDLDLLVSTNNGSAHLFRNEGGNLNNALRVKTIGTTANRDGIGARVEISLPGGETQWQLVKTGSSYCSQSELPVTFGVGNVTKVPKLQVKWPGGRVETISDVPANRTVTIQEGRGLIEARPFEKLKQTSSGL
jgi:hypothetical protein